MDRMAKEFAAAAAAGLLCCAGVTGAAHAGQEAAQRNRAAEQRATQEAQLQRRIHEVQELARRGDDAAVAELIRVAAEKSSVDSLRRQVVLGLASRGDEVGDRGLLALAEAGSIPMPTRELSVEQLGQALRSRGSRAAAEALGQLQDPSRAPRPLSACARRAVDDAVRNNTSRFDAFAASNVPTVQKAAEKERARIRSLHPTMPLSDIVAIEGWRQHRIERLEIQIDRCRELRKTAPDHFDRQKRELSKAAVRYRSMRPTEAGVEILAEFYDATRRAEQAVRAVERCADLALAAEQLPVITWTEQQYEVTSDGRQIPTIETEHEFDLSIVGWFISAAGMDAEVAAKEAFERAQHSYAVLSRLDAATVSLVKQGLARRIAKERRSPR